MFNIFRKLRFFLSELFFIKILNKRPVKDVVSEVEKKVDESNKDYTNFSCNACGHDKYTKKIIGSEGIFTSTSSVYVCAKCGNEQEEKGTEFCYLSEELEKKRIVKDGGDYRYYFIKGVVWLFIIFIVMVFIIFRIGEILIKFL